MFTALLTGFFVGASLIIAIGAQNAFILRQGLMRQHVFVLCLICALSDAFLIVLGVGGFGAIISSKPLLLTITKWGGAAFLLAYAFLAFRRAFNTQVLNAGAPDPISLTSAIATCLALTFLNPHVYLDTVILLGGVSVQFGEENRFAFGAGAVVASFVWFFALGYGARLLDPIFAKPVSWRVLDIGIGLIMTSIAISLLVG
jgi:L-lysine exporter family protein LysE/ArgO